MGSLDGQLDVYHGYRYAPSKKEKRGEKNAQVVTKFNPVIESQAHLEVKNGELIMF